MNNSLLLTLLFILVSALPIRLSAELKPNALFADHMVLQQKMELPIWGSARDGEKITIDFAGQHVTTVAKDAKWTTKLKPLLASTTPQTLAITGDSTVVIKDVLVGEVWLCSGQSNMERQLGPRSGQKPIDNWEQEQADAKYPTIRHFLVGRKIAPELQTDVTGQWVVCSPETVKDFTAVGYFFARDLLKVINVPIGLIHSSWGGTPAEAWTRSQVFAATPGLHAILEAQAKAIEDYPGLLAKYKTDEPMLLQKYDADLKQALAEAKPTPRKPQPPRDPVANNPNQPSVLYNGMIAPLEPYAMRGVIWYQGESNGGRANQYCPLFSAMIGDWRKVWGEGEFPFLFVQIAPFGKMNPEIREAQRQTLKRTANTAMAVITDSGDAADIHPSHKQAPGARLALAAEALAYGKNIEYSGPAYEAMKVNGGKVELTFSHIGSGLMAKDGDLKGFTVAGADKNFLPAKAEIQGGHVLVSNEQIATPMAVRYGWASVPEVNLYNKDGLPASPFRTDE